MASEAVFSNRDLVRQMLSQSSHALPLLSTTKSIRSAEPCASTLEEWRRVGCPTHPAAGLEKRCLSAIGGLANPLCRLEYDVSVATKRGVLEMGGVPAASVADTVISIAEPNLVTMLTLGSTVLRVRHGVPNQLTVTRDNWRHRGTACRPSDAELRTLLRTILTTTGSIQLPCGAGTLVHAPRMIQLTVTSAGETLMTATRR